MSFIREISAVFLILIVTFVSVPLSFAQVTKGSLLRGYRTGYSDGYMAGYRDLTERSQRNFAKHQEYTKANRVYRSEYGSLEDYRDGYQQGFEAGYVTGYDRREFDSSLPTNLSRRGTKTAQSQSAPEPEVVKPEAPKLREAAIAPDIPLTTTSETPAATNNNSQSSATSDLQTATSDAPIVPDNAPAATNNAQNDARNIDQAVPPQKAAATPDATIIIPTNTEIVVEMLADVNTDDNQAGDKFLARVVAPTEIGGAIVEGHVARLKKPGRVKGTAELQLSFDRIVVNEKRWANFNATVIEALPTKGNNIKKIDEEGTVEGKRSVKGDVVKVSAATASGAGIGAIAGGPVGAAVGAAIGGALGIGGVLVERGKNINLAQSQQLRVRTNFESQIR